MKLKIRVKKEKGKEVEEELLKLGVEILQRVTDGDEYKLIFQNPPNFYRDIHDIRKRHDAFLEILEQYVVDRKVADISTKEGQMVNLQLR